MKRKWIRFGLQSFFACISLVALVAMALGWRTDRIQLQKTVRAFRRQGQLLNHANPAIYSKSRLFGVLNQPGVIGRSVAEFPDVPGLRMRHWRERGRVNSIWQEALKNVQGQQCTGYFFSFGDAHVIEEFEARVSTC